MPPIAFFASETTRDKEWDSIAAVHSGLVTTTTWSFDKCRMGDLKIVPEKFHNKNRTDFDSVAVCLCLTQCGNFVVIGKNSLIQQLRSGASFPECFLLPQAIHPATLNASTCNQAYTVQRMVIRHTAVSYAEYIVTI